ncbi:MAG: MotA/TolQ/ExbB proton channel family protein [Verrucomicrobia bacterium]|nr:MotA/TolQ/ExbB proton channel family protein [Verrucomicrobiota bacterium]
MRRRFALLSVLTLIAVNPLVSAGTEPAADPPAPASVAIHSTGWAGKLKAGGNTALVQLALSMFGAGFAFERVFRLRRKYLAPVGLSQRARELWADGDFSSLERFGESEPSTLGRVIAFIARNRTAPMTEVSAICGDLVSRELAGHYQRAYPLGIVATLAPLLGLLGMILGMIETFETVSLAGSLGDATQLAGGISEALVTTGLGIAVAIPFLALYHTFKHRTAGFGITLEEEVTDLLTTWLMRRSATPE